MRIIISTSSNRIQNDSNGNILIPSSFYEFIRSYEYNKEVDVKFNNNNMPDSLVNTISQLSLAYEYLINNLGSEPDQAVLDANEWLSYVGSNNQYPIRRLFDDTSGKRVPAWVL